MQSVSKGIDSDAKRLVIARLDALPSNIGIAVGSAGNFSKQELLDRIEKEDEIGQMFVDLDISYLRALKDGTLFE